MPERGDAKLFEVLGGEAREDPLVDLVVAECRLVFSRPRLRSQTTMSMTGAYNRGWRTSSARERSVSRGREVPMVLELHNVRLG